MFKNKKILITGGSGMIGRQLVDLLLERGGQITVADLNEPINMPNQIEFKKIDLRNFDDCINICTGQDFVFSLVGIKASPKITMEQPADIMVPMLQFNTNIIEASRICKVKWFLYTSTVGVYTPAEILYEDNVWEGFPSKNDWFGGWAKRMGELQCESYEKQYGESRCSIVRPANVYGPYDNFDIDNSMVIPSLIRKSFENDIIEVWGDGSSIRDFVHARDVARGMIFAVENKITQPINLGSGSGVAIKELAEIISNYSNKPLKWLTDKPTGDPKRIFSMDRAHSYGFRNETNLRDGIIDTMEWFSKNKHIADKRFNILKNNSIN